MSSTNLLPRSIPGLVRRVRNARQASSLTRSSGILQPPCFLPSQEDRWHWQQVRYKRRDGDRYADRERKPSKKQLKNYNRKIQSVQAKQDKHSAPGSKAGPRREFAQALKETYLNSDKGNGNENSDLLDYDFNDALLDDLMGNTKDLSSQPTPEPVYLGDKHRKYFNHVADQMARYRKTMEQLQEGMSQEEAALIEVTELPTDKALSLVVRSYRDRHGTRRNPVGIVKALRHVLQDLQVPISIFGEYTYTSLLSSCRTPAEGRRIFKMMKENKHPISPYSWSILVDLYAKVADFEGCATTMDEMVEVGGVAPTLAAFTSLLSACYKVCNDGRIPHSIRARAGEMAWKKWQEMRVVGISPDVMAYGAILRVCAARGHAERAINLLEEMQQMEVKPTTLCFSSALRAVARSHAIANRFERGSSGRHRRREFLTQHHGNMARSLVVMAENAEVEQDDGFVAALILCAASAGDMATAKAIYVASEIRRLDQLRTIGSDEHLARLRGEKGSELIFEQQQLLSLNGSLSNEESIAVSAEGDESELSLVKSKGRGEVRSFETREYGNDTRTLSGILHACALAVDKNGMGLMWQGRENKGFLCDNSLRLLTARRLPQYTSNSIPGEGTTDNLTWEGEYADVDRKHKLGKRSKFKGVWEDENSAATLDELDESYLKMFIDKDGKLRPEFQKMTSDDVWKLKYGDEKNNEDLVRFPVLEQEKHEDDEQVIATKSSMYFDSDSMRWITASDTPEEVKFVGESMADLNKQKSVLETGNDKSSVNDSTPGVSAEAVDDLEEELFFDDTEMRWKTRVRTRSLNVIEKTQFEAEILSLGENNEAHDSSEGFDEFFKALNDEILENGEDEATAEEAREIYDQLKVEILDDAAFSDKRIRSEDEVFTGNDIDATSTQTGVKDPKIQPESKVQARVLETNLYSYPWADELDSSLNQEEDGQLISNDFDHSELSTGDSDKYPKLELSDSAFNTAEPDLDLLRELLPNFSETRIRRIRRVFKTSLGDPSMLDLVPLIRERMPDYITSAWLKHMGVLTSRFVLHKAAERNIVDQHVLNNALELEISAGSLDRAIEFYDTKFSEHSLQPNGYSDRIMIQMFLENNRFSRALEFKERVEHCGRSLDLASYGSLVEYVSKRGHLGSALVLLKECIRVHQSAPRESAVSKLRVICSQAGMIEESGLIEMIGDDPAQWLKHGEAHLKREMSKKGRRDVVFARNKAIQL